MFRVLLLATVCLPGLALAQSASQLAPSATATLPIVRLVATGTTDTASDTAITTIKWTSTSAAAKVESIPACAAGNKGLTLTVKDGAGTAGTYAIVVTPISGTVDSAASFAINTSRGSYAFQCDGAGDWSVG